MNEEILDSAESTNGERPVFLTVICILSFIGAGFGILGYLAAFTAMGVASNMDLSAIEGVEALQSSGPGMGMTWAFIIVGLITTIIALLGVVKMWKLKKDGFMMYAGAMAVNIIMGIIFSGFAASIVGIIITGAFIAMYYVNLKHMKN